MKHIQLTNGPVTLVSDEDYDHLMLWNWRCINKSTVGRGIRSNGQYINIRISVIIADRMGLNTKEFLIDHRDRDPLNNQRINLREANHFQNGANRVKSNKINNGTNFKGIYFRKRRNKWKWSASIKVNYSSISLGDYDTEEEAALAYNKAALKYFGEFAVLNEV